MDGTSRSNVRAGTKVKVVQKPHQATGELTEGIVKRILTKTQTHPRGMKVMLESGIIGRVQEVIL